MAAEPNAAPPALPALHSTEGTLSKPQYPVPPSTTSAATNIGSPTLAEQDLASLDINRLTPLSLEVMRRQATINFGTIGHVAHGKSTVVRAISGVQTVRFKNEKERNITIKLGYANAKIYKCSNPNCPPPGCYASYGSTKEDSPPCTVPNCGHPMVLQRHVSFVDCPGHDILMATMLNGAAVMDAALLLIAGNEACPQPQTSEHLAAVELLRLRHIIVLQNKVELLRPDQAETQYNQIEAFLKHTTVESAPIVPISAVLKYNIDVVCQYICTQIPVPVRNFTDAPRMIIIRSFDVNKPGDQVEELRGGVAGGSILQGVLKVGDEIEIRPGVITKEEGKQVIRPIRSTVVSLFAENNDLKFAVPGGLIGVGTKIDATLARSDRLAGHVLGVPSTLPDIYMELEIQFCLLCRLLGVKKHAKGTSSKLNPPKRAEMLMINVGSTSVGGRVLFAEEGIARIELLAPVCTKINAKVALSRRIEKHWRLIGWGTITKGTQAQMLYEEEDSMGPS